MKPWAAIARLGGIGDNLMTSSVLPLLAKDYSVEVISQAPQSCVYENNPHVSKLSVKREGEIPGDTPLIWQRWFADRAGEYAKFVHLSHSCETFVALTSGQTAYYWPQEWRQRYCDQNYLEIIHDIVGVPHDFNPRFYPTEDEAVQARATKAMVSGGPVIGWCLAGSRLDKVYPHAPLVIARLIRDLGLPVILFGAPREGEIKLAKDVRRHVLRVNGNVDQLQFAMPKWRGVNEDDPITLDQDEVEKWPIRRSLALLQQCDMVIGPDTGTMWSVAMEAIPKIVLLSHASPKNITKHWRATHTLHANVAEVPCWPCHRLIDDPKDCRPNLEKTAAACISSISVESIVRAAAALLGDARVSSGSPEESLPYPPNNQET